MATNTFLHQGTLISITVKNPFFVRVLDGGYVVKQFFGPFAKQRATKFANARDAH